MGAVLRLISADALRLGSSAPSHAQGLTSQPAGTAGVRGVGTWPGVLVPKCDGQIDDSKADGA